MIITRSWLNEWVDLSDISTQQLCKKLNDLGLEVDGVKSYTVPEKVVVGKIVSCEKHPDADKLNVCTVDVGTDTRQIVCGAKNVVDAEYVAVAMIGAVLPGNFEIKHAKLRGVESEGMICSSEELGLPKMNDGIMQLDASVGKLTPGIELRGFSLFDDDVIEIDLTPNRGDCLSIHGVARDLSAAFNKELKTFESGGEDRASIGIGKILSFVYDDIDGVNMHYKVAEVKKLQVPFIVQLRLATVEKQIENDIDKLLYYTTHESGVILRAYDFGFFGEKKAKLTLQEDEYVQLTGSAEAAAVGINQSDTSLPQNEKIILEASYIRPDKIVPVVATTDIKPDELYFRTSRGSEPDVDFGMELLAKNLAACSKSNIYSGSSTFYSQAQRRSISVNLQDVENLIGQKVDRTDVSNVLKHLGFTIQNLESDRFGVIVPAFRHDVMNMQDITEEIVRMIGIDNIAPKRMKFVEHNRLNPTMARFKFKRDLKQRAAANGYFEVMTYLFCENKKLEHYGFETVQEKLAVVNPITSDMDGLRSTALLNMLEAAQRNINYGKKSVRLFEIGTVFNAKREERDEISFVFCGAKSDENITNAGKPEEIDVEEFIKTLGSVIGDFELKSCSYENRLLHPYQSADIVIKGETVGFLSKLHPDTEFELPTGFVASVNLDALLPEKKEVGGISNYQGVTRDLSLLVDKKIPYEQIRSVLETVENPMLKSFYPVDLFEDKSLGKEKSLTVRFFIQSTEGTLGDKDIEPIMDSVLKTAEAKLGAKLR